ncbi:preprotein translocase subunit SecY [Gloeobacter violaceus]|uniref:Protein translocase subunit SecY n=1 Tax=Gloeobacter violaceus (strain ATCC 29082 / PCC 7421) TaxID=251221 RepID=Q7NKT4_GLOVI|nr:preprotein translocase subunit SecY [Gloeobacter violaceus]BAC89334.1 preprotein translocase subunit [Gloeobacter violaceus PCC 7421]
MERGRERQLSAQETFAQMASASGLRRRLLFTLGLLVLSRIGIYIPLPEINQAAFQQATQNNAIIGFLNIFAGGGFTTLGVFMLGILPYINASIIMQLLVPVFPKLEDLQKNEGEQGRRQIAQYTRYLALGWAIIQSIGVAIYIKPFVADWSPLFVIQTTLALTAGAIFVMWLGELITEKGIGNGASLLIFVSIVSSLPTAFSQTFQLLQADSSRVAGVVVLLLVFLAMIVGIVFVQEGTRRIPIISARRQVGPRRQQYQQQQTSYLPLRVNQGGVMPIIFASSLLYLPLTFAQFARNATVDQVVNAISSGWIHNILYLVLILFFSFFYATLIINPEDVSKNLKRMGSSIPGVRPGTATSEYIAKVMNRLTFLGAIFLSAVAIIPTFVEQGTGITTFNGLGATSLLILVGVAIDTVRQIQTYVISQRYEGMVKR